MHHRYRLFRSLLVSLSVFWLALTACSSATSDEVADDEHHQGREGEHVEGDEHEMALPQLESVVLGEGEKLRVVASTNIVGDVVSQVGSDAIDLTVLMELGQDPHSYEPTPADLADIEMAHVVFVNGLDLEEGLLDVIEAQEGGAPVVPVSAGIEPRALGHEDEREGEDQEEEGQHAEHAHEGGDPHTWMDPHNVEIWVANIAEVLSELDPANTDTYQVNAAAYVEQLQELDAYILEQISGIPENERKLVTNHESFGYFADRYGFEVVGTVFVGASELAKPSGGDMAVLVDTIEAEGARAIFVETTVSEELATVVADEVGYDVSVLTLYTGSLGELGSGADSYIGMMRANVDAIVTGLEQDAG